MTTEIKESAEELLETMWIRTVEGKESSLSLDELPDDDKAAVEQLAKSGHVNVSNSRITLTGSGCAEARSVVRRHRLAERLLADVLGTGEAVLHEKACKFEHLLDRGLDDNICILLGHPKVCPHGKPIPPGRCCLEDERQPQKVVSALSQLNPGQRGKVAYIYSPESSQLQKLMAMGILPGALVRLIQSFPSYVFQVGESQFAVDRQIADSIYVRLMEEVAASEAEGEPARRRQRRSLGFRRRGRR